MTDVATAQMIGLLRALADELEAGNGVALKVEYDTPKGMGYHNEMSWTRTYSLSLVMSQEKPEVRAP